MTDHCMYFSTDIESDGPLVGVHSMISLGCVAFSDEGQEVSSFSMNLKPLSGATQDHDTMKWWSERPGAWAAATKDPSEPDAVMHAFTQWISGIAGPRNAKPIFAAYPTVYDYGFVRWYLIRFTGNDPFCLRSVDIRSYAMRAIGKDYPASKMSALPAKYTDGMSKQLSHLAVEDARDQGRVFMKMYLESLGIRKIQ